MAKVVRDSAAVVPWQQQSLQADGDAAPAPPASVTDDSLPAQLQRNLSGGTEATPQDPEGLVKYARREADRILEQGREELEQVRAQGYEEGLRQVEQEFAPLRQHFTSLLAEMEPAVAEYLCSQTDELVDLAFAIAERIVGEQLAMEPQRVVRLVDECLPRVAESTRLRVLLHPGDLDLIERAGHLNELKIPSGTQLVAEATMERGGCRVESDQGAVDASLPGRWERLRTIVLAAEARLPSRASGRLRPEQG